MTVEGRVQTSKVTPRWPEANSDLERCMQKIKITARIAAWHGAHKPADNLSTQTQSSSVTESKKRKYRNVPIKEDIQLWWGLKWATQFYASKKRRTARCPYSTQFRWLSLVSRETWSPLRTRKFEPETTCTQKQLQAVSFMYVWRLWWWGCLWPRRTSTRCRPAQW